MRLLLRLIFNIAVTALLTATMSWVTLKVLSAIAGGDPPAWSAYLLALLAGAIPGFAIAKAYKAPSFYLGGCLGAGAVAGYGGDPLLALLAAIGIIAGHLFGLKVQRKLNPAPLPEPTAAPESGLTFAEAEACAHSEAIGELTVEPDEISYLAWDEQRQCQCRVFFHFADAERAERLSSPLTPSDQS